MKFKEFVMTEYIPYKKRRVKPSSIGTYMSILRGWLIPTFGEFTYDQFTRRVVENYALDLLENTRMRKKSVEDIIILLKNTLRTWAEEHELPLKAIRVDWPTDDSKYKALDTYSPKELKKVVDYVWINPKPQYVAIAIAIATGMRIGEICALQYGDIDVEKKVLYVRKTIERLYDPNNEIEIKDGLISSSNKTKIIVSTPKTATSYRAIPLIPQLLVPLKNLKKVYPDDFFIATNSLKPTEPRTFRNAYKKLILQKVGLSRCIRFHGLRHSFATNLIAGGADIKTTSVLLGHTDIQTTLNIYTHPSEESKIKALKSTLKNIF